jgi:hypothetical protein
VAQEAVEAQGEAENRLREGRQEPQPAARPAQTTPSAFPTLVKAATACSM